MNCIGSIMREDREKKVDRKRFFFYPLDLVPIGCSSLPFGTAGAVGAGLRVEV